MKKVLISLSVATALFLSGCASNGMALNTAGGNRVDRAFIEGTITKQQKVIIDDRETATLTGAGVGAVAGVGVGALSNGSKGAMTGGILGAVAGGITGALVGKEIEAYQTTITADNGQTYQGYLQQRLNEGSCVEFTTVENKLKNVNVVTCKQKPVTVQQQTVKTTMPSVQSVTGIIIKRENLGDKWFYVVRDDKTKQNLIMEADQSYPYLRDRVSLTYQGENTITGMKLVEREAINEIQPKQAPKPQPKASAPVTAQPVMQEQPKETKAEVTKVETKMETVTETKAETTTSTKKSAW